jgi:PAS domain S-box-containing protein
MDRDPGSIRVLHVDDEPDFAKLAASFLEREDDRLDVEPATGSDEGLARLAAEPFDCIVSDYDMPDRNGLEFLEAVREAHGDIPFILFTGKGSEEVASEAISAGVSDYLQKERGTDQYAILANRIRNTVGQRRAERAAARSERRLTELAANSNDILWSFTADWGELLFMNETYEELWGQPIGALEAEPTAFLEAIHPDDRARTMRAMEILSDGEQIDIEIRVNAETGHERWSWVQGTPITDDGEVVRVAGFARDITDRKRRERALEELHTVAAELPGYGSRERICQRIVTAAQNILDFDLCVANLAEGGRLVPAASSGESPPDGVRAMAADEGIVGRTYRTGETVRVDDIRHHPDAEPQGGYRSALTISLGDHGVFQAAADVRYAFDETDTELAELLVAHAVRALDQLTHEQELERHETILEALGDPIYTVDEDGCYTFVNDAYSELTGYDREEIVGEHASFLLDEASVERANDCIRALLSTDSTGRQCTYEITVETADGREIPCEDNLALLPLADGAYRGAAGVVRDITGRVERERELERQNEQLERFASVVSHDLRSPLNVAAGRLDIARAERDSEHLATAAHALDRMDELVGDILTLAREGATVTDPEPVDLADAAEACWRHVETGAATLTIETDDTVRADRSRLEELLGNLVRNAVEHGSTGSRPQPDDGPPVAVTVGDLPDGFHVADDGPGIPEEARERVFESGYSTVEDGTGFGLNIVAEIAEAHGWDVDIDESRAGGARFEFTGVEIVD